MRVKLYVFEDELEGRYGEDKVVKCKGTEPRAVFIQRLKRMAADEFLVSTDDIDILEITKAVVEENDDMTLAEAYKHSFGLQRKLIFAVMEERKMFKVEKHARRLVPQTAEQMKATKEYSDCEVNVHKYIKFSPHKQEVVLEARISGLALNKTNTKVYYNIVLEDLSRTCVASDNPTIEFIEKPKWASNLKTRNRTKKHSATDIATVA